MRAIIVAAGGTGGHVMPAEALAAGLAQRNHRVVVLTDARAADAFAGREKFVLEGAGVAGRGLARGAAAAVALARGTVQARRILSAMDVVALVGFGGYPQVAPLIAAHSLRGRPAIVLHEQNAVLGRAHRLFARHADALALSFATTTKVPSGAHAVYTGNPVRPSIGALYGLAYTSPAREIRLVVLGGSLGARVFSDVVPTALAALPEPLRARLRVSQQCRPEDLPRVAASYQAAGIHAELAAFFSNVPVLLASAHLVIARAGASTVAELSMAGRPSILVPLPRAIDGHQAANAQALANAGGAWVMRQDEFTPAALGGRLASLLADTARLATAATAASAFASADAVTRLADLVDQSIAARRAEVSR